MKRVLVPLAEGFEEMEGIIIIDVLRRAGVEVVSAGLQSGEIPGARGTRHLADMTIEKAAEQKFDMIVLPGGAENLEKHPTVQALLRNMKAADKHIGAICAAPNALRNLKIIQDEDVFTLHPATLNTGKGGKYVSDQRVVHSGKITTSIGAGSAFEFALELVEILCGTEVKEKTAGPMYLPA